MRKTTKTTKTPTHRIVKSDVTGWLDEEYGICHTWTDILWGWMNKHPDVATDIARMMRDSGHLANYEEDETLEVTI